MLRCRDEMEVDRSYLDLGTGTWIQARVDPQRFDGDEAVGYMLIRWHILGQTI
jgi:hypothetical protein